jgi:flagellar FliJ protein
MSAGAGWNRLKDLASRRREASAERLRELARKRDEAQQKLDALLGYRAEYEARLAGAKRGGMDVDALRNYEAFLDKLGRAIAQQRELLADATRHADHAKQSWNAEHKRVKSYEILEQRRTLADARTERRRDQKATDEWASSTLLRLSRTERR